MERAVGGMGRRGRYALAAAAGIAVVLCWGPLRTLLWQLAGAGLLFALALPVEKQLERWASRPLASGGAVGVLLIVILGLVSLLVPTCIAQISWVIGQAPGLLSRLQGIWEELMAQEWVQALGLQSDAPGKWIQSIGAWAAGALPQVISGIGAGVDWISRAFLAPILAYYFLRDREAFAYRLSLWIPLRQRKQALGALREMRREAGGYLRGQLLVALAVGVLTAVGLLLVGIPAWLALGLLMGACELIPYVGPLIGGVPIVLFSLPLGMETVLWAVGITIAVQQLEGYFLSPHLMGGATGLHPVYILLLLSTGGLLFGLIGMVLALPVFVCIRGAVRVLWPRPDREGDGAGKAAFPRLRGGK